jgi:hypothetical protein
MKKNIYFVSIITALLFINIHYSATSYIITTSTFSNVVKAAHANGESGELVPCYITYDTPSIFRKDTEERRCSDCIEVKGHDWNHPDFCPLP